MTTPLWAWFASIALIGLLVVADIRMGRGRSQPTIRRAAVISIGWVAMSVAFGTVVGALGGRDDAEQFFTGYLLEKALSVDNIFVIALLLGSFAVPADSQRRVLSYGVLGALVLRGVFIAAGAALVANVSWIFYLFGAVLVVSGLRMLRSDHEANAQENGIVRAARRLLPVSASFDGDRFLSLSSGSRLVTPLFIALVAIETTDLVFALDSIPAIFGVTQNTFIVFTSNAFAVLGLRALYFVFAGSIKRFAYLNYGLAAVLSFIGIKMLVADIVEVPTMLSLGVIIGVVSISMLLSPRRPESIAPYPEHSNPISQH